jgi:hypothetical protein
VCLFALVLPELARIARWRPQRSYLEHEGLLQLAVGGSGCAVSLTRAYLSL